MPTPALVAIIVVAVVAALAGAAIWLRGRLRDAGIYVIPRTKFGMALVFSVEGDDGEPVRVLNVGGMYQSATFLDDRYTELSSRMTSCSTACSTRPFPSTAC